MYVYARAAVLRALPASLAELYDGVRRRIGPLRVDRVLPSSRARASSEEPQQLLRRSPGRDDARSGGRARAIGRRTLGTPVDGAHGRWKPHRDSVISAPLRYFVVFGGFSHDVRCLTAGLSFNVI